MKISIITPTKNSSSTIRETIESVVSQKGIEKEYIIVDGMSNDSTLNIINEYKTDINKVISEKDQGLYYAMNKGISYATGDIIAILNSDDLYTDESCLSSVMQIFEKTNTEIVYGNIQIIDSKEKIIRKWISSPFKKSALKNGWCPPHPAFFIKRKLYEEFGFFDTDYIIAADYDLMLRMLTNTTSQPQYINKILVKMKSGGISKNNIKGLINKLKEDISVLKKNNLPIISGVLGKKLSKLMQFKV